MFDVGEKVTVIADKGITYDGIILARATGDSGLEPTRLPSMAAGPNKWGN